MKCYYTLSILQTITVFRYSITLDEFITIVNMKCFYTWSFFQYITVLHYSSWDEIDILLQDVVMK